MNAEPYRETRVLTINCAATKWPAPTSLLASLSESPMVIISLSVEGLQAPRMLEVYPGPGRSSSELFHFPRFLHVGPDDPCLEVDPYGQTVAVLGVVSLRPHGARHVLIEVGGVSPVQPAGCPVAAPEPPQDTPTIFPGEVGRLLHAGPGFVDETLPEGVQHVAERLVGVARTRAAGVGQVVVLPQVVGHQGS